MPVDAKFPMEAYNSLKIAEQAANTEELEKHLAMLIRAIKDNAKLIQSKYLNPPHTTDFAIMFLPTEGLYSTVASHGSLLEQVQSQYRVMIAGPTNLAALLNSLQMGFKTLAIEQRASEVWHVLAGVKTEFQKFGEVLVKIKKQVQTVSMTLDLTETRTKAMTRKLQDIESLPTEKMQDVFNLEPIA
jgi:DNA recombination protein RmuC